MEKYEKIIDIGLDIGIASVGWSITNKKTLEIIKHGVRLFPTVDHPKDSKLANEERRMARSARRQINRRKTLKRDFVKFLIDSKFIDNIEFDKEGKFVQIFRDQYINNASLHKKYCKEFGQNYTFYLRKKGLSKKLNKNELIIILYWYLLHRGFKYEVIDNKKKNENSQKDKEEAERVNKNREKYKNKFPIEGQIAFLEKHNYLNGSYNRHIKSTDYVKEIEQIFSNQNISKEFKDKFLSDDFFLRQRSFEQGPGNSKTHTEYGIYQFNPKTNKIEKKYENIWEKTIGKCSFYPNEFRAPKNSLTSEIFNLLNDLNNITIRDENPKLTKEEKVELIKVALKTKECQNQILKTILKLRNIDKNDSNFITGYNKDSKKAITSLTSFHSFIVKKENLLSNKFYEFDYLFDENLKFNKGNVFDKIINVFSKYKTIEQRINQLQFLPETENAEKIVKNVSNSFSNNHSLSYKAMHEMIDVFIKENMNQMEYANQNEHIRFNLNRNVGTYYLKNDWIEEIIVSPTVKRSFRQTTKILNAIFEKAKKNKWKIDSIVIEMARESNNKAVRENETNRQKYFENLNSRINEQILKDYPEKIKTNTLRNKIWFLLQQKCKDAYDGKEITIDELISNPGSYDLDHIIPRSQSFSNNRSNIVLTKNIHNHQKKNDTPFQYLSDQEFARMKKMWEEWYKPSEKDRQVFKDKNKLDYLTTDINYKDPNNQLGFIQRNLVDTRTITKEILNALNEFKKSDKNPFDYKVKTINGKMTSFFRSKLENDRSKTLERPEDIDLKDKNGKKNRDWHGHHAEDAYIITVINSEYGKSKIVEKSLSSNSKFDPFIKYDYSTGEVKENEKYDNLIKKVDLTREQLNKNLNEIYFSRMVEKKQSVKLFKETLFASKYDKVNKTFSKIQRVSIADLANKDATKYFSINAKEKENLQIFWHNKNLYKSLCEIYRNYSDEKLPFKIAIQESSKEFLEVIFKNKKGQKIKNIVKKIAIVKQSGKTGKNPLRIARASGNNGNSFYEGLNWMEIQIFKDNKGKYKILTIDASNHKISKKDNEMFLKPKKDIMKTQKEFKNIPLDSNPYVTLNKGDLIEDPNGTKMWVSGVEWTSNKLEMKFINKKTSGRKHISINAMKNWKIIKNSNLISLGKIKIFEL